MPKTNGIFKFQRARRHGGTPNDDRMLFNRFFKISITKQPNDKNEEKAALPIYLFIDESTLTSNNNSWKEDNHLVSKRKKL